MAVPKLRVMLSVTKATAWGVHIADPEGHPLTDSTDMRVDATALDELLLLRDGLLTHDEVSPPEAPLGTTFVDLEGVPVATVTQDGYAWHDDDSRAFARLYGTPQAGDDSRHALWVDQPSTRLIELARHGSVLFVPTSPSHLLGHRAASAVHSALAAARARPDLTVIAVPVDLGSHPQRQRMIDEAFGVSRSELVSDIEKATATGTFILLTGLSGSGKSTIARALREDLVARGETVTLLDGDQVRRELSSGLGFSPADRDTNVRRIGWVGAEIAAHGGVVVACPIAPYDATRRQVRRMVEQAGARMILVHVATPVQECERRDRKGLYAKARAGEIPDFTGLSAPYEVPTDADLVIDTTHVSAENAVTRIIDLLKGTRR